jgi:hypothetical protein
MKTAFTFFTALLLLVITQSFQCGRGAYTRCDSFKTDTVLLNTTITNPALEYHLYDTIWLSSTVTDTYSPLSGNPVSFTNATEVLYLNIQPYSILTNNSLPSLQYANIEFNPVVREGLLQYPGYMGYIYQYRRQSPNNTLIAGLVPGRTGLYLIELNPGTYIYSSFSVFNPGEQCATYYGVSNLPAAQQNKSYWNGLGVSALSTSINYGSHTVSINMRNYLIVKVIP